MINVPRIQCIRMNKRKREEEQSVRKGKTDRYVGVIQPKKGIGI
jgi:hypothetical protein